MNKWIGLALLVVAMAVIAAGRGWWEVGRFNDEQQAVRQAERISGAAGIEVWLMPVGEGSARAYRLLVRSFPDEVDQARLKTQLRSVGVDNPRTFEFDGDTSDLRSVFSVVGAGIDQAAGRTAPETDSRISTPSTQPADMIGLSDNVSGYLVVAGSFREYEMADAYRQELSSGFADVGVVSSDVDGRRLHRVVVGPVRGGVVDEIKQTLTERGVKAPWVLRYTGNSVQASVAPSRKTQPVEASPRRSVPRDQQAPPKNGYNPAKLRRDAIPFRDTP